MRRVILTVAAAGALALTGTSTAAASGPHASGGGKWAGGACNFGFAANLTPAGKVLGAMSLTKCVGGFEYHAKPTCLRVEGTEATVGGEVTRSNNPMIPVGSGLVFYMQDNGEPGAGTDEFFAVSQPNPPEECPGPLPALPVTNGNVNVRE